MCSFHKVKKLNLKIMNVRFQYKADIRVECSERLLSSESGHSAKPIELLLSAKSGHSNFR